MERLTACCAGKLLFFGKITKTSYFKHSITWCVAGTTLLPGMPPCPSPCHSPIAFPMPHLALGSRSGSSEVALSVWGHRVHGWFISQVHGIYVSLSFPEAPASLLSWLTSAISSSFFYSQPEIPSVPPFLRECTVSTPWGGLCYSAGFRKAQGVCIRQGYAPLQTLCPWRFQPLLQRGVPRGFDPSHAGAAWQHLALRLLHDCTSRPRKLTGHSHTHSNEM